MFPHASVILFTIGLMDTRSLLILVGYSVTPCYGAVGTHTTEMLSCFRQMFEEFNDGQQDKHGFILFPTLLHPQSVGSIRLKSQNPFDYPLIDPEYLEDEQDVEILLDGNLKFKYIIYFQELQKEFVVKSP